MVTNSVEQFRVGAWPELGIPFVPFVEHQQFTWDMKHLRVVREPIRPRVVIRLAAVARIVFGEIRRSLFGELRSPRSGRETRR
jgi:hypothetical protein